MIFDKDCYDKSLWLMLNIDDDIRGIIADFISNLPSELVTIIRESILDFRNKDIFDGIDNSRLSGNYELDNGVLYWYTINAFLLGALDIGYSIYINGRYEKILELTLVPFKKSLDTNQWIGNIEYDIQKNIVNEEISFISSRNNEYNLVRTPFGYFVVCYKGGRSFIDTGIKRIGFNNIPEEIFIDDISSIDNVNKLIKSRKWR